MPKFALLLVLLAGCASYKVDSTPLAMEGKSVGEPVTTGSLETSAQMYRSEKVAKAAFGISPRSTGMLPVVVRIENRGESPVRFELERTTITGPDGVRYRALAIDAAIERARAGSGSAIASAIAFGMVGLMVSASSTEKANRTMEVDYLEKRFKPLIVNPGCRGEGVVFFEVPAKRQAAVVTLSSITRSLSDDKEVETAIPLAELRPE